MRAQSRVYLAVRDGEKWERALSADSRFAVLGGSGEGDRVVREVRALEPDCAALDLHLVGADALTLLETWKNTLAAPPRVLVICPPGEEAWGKRALALGADRTAAGEGDFSEALYETARLPLPALSEAWAETRTEKAVALMEKMGVPRGLKGREYMTEAAAALSCAPALGRNLRERLYPYLAGKFSVTPGSVERAVRTAVESTWLKGDLDGIQALFGMTVDAERGKPTNAECLMMLGEHVRREMNRYLAERSAT